MSQDIRRSPVKLKNRCAYCARPLKPGWQVYLDYMGGRHRMHKSCKKFQERIE